MPKLCVGLQILVLLQPALMPTDVLCSRDYISYIVGLVFFNMSAGGEAETRILCEIVRFCRARPQHVLADLEPSMVGLSSGKLGSQFL